MGGEAILVIDDDRGNCDLLADILSREGFEVTTAHNGAEAIRLLDEYCFDVVLTDLRMPEVDGIKVLEYLKQSSPCTPGIVFTGYGSIESAVEAMKAGAFDYITKPFHMDEMKIVIKKALEYQKLQKENIILKRQLKKKYKFENIIGDSKPIQKVFEMIEKVADTDSTVLIQGESGTGKELVARAIHYNSHRSNKPLIPVNCGAIPENLLESELFGYEKGAFTGAHKTRIGRFEMANGGTIFLDEVSDMSPALQVKLLRVLQEQKFERIGGVKSTKVDVRIIAATNKDLEKAVAQGTFREDLFYRLNVIPIVLPPLRERKSDIPLLVHHFLKRFNQTKKRNVTEISPEALELLMNYHWPGNVRELENLIDRLVVLNTSGIIRPEDLPEKIIANQNHPSSIPHVPEIPDEGLCFKTVVSQFERELILQALKKSKGVKNKAAQLLKIKRTTLVEKLKREQIDRGKSCSYNN